MRKITLYIVAIITVFTTVFTACKKDEAVTGVTLNKNTLTLTVGQDETLVASVLPGNAANKSATWSSDDPSVATVYFGVVSAKSEGTAIITVTTTDGGKTDRCTVTVQATSVPVTGITLNHAFYSLEVGDNLTLTANVLPESASNRAVTWSSSDQSAVVNNNGRVTAVSPGTAIITATTVDGNKQVNCTLTISPVPTPATTCGPVPEGIGYETLDDIGMVTFLSNTTWIVGNREWSDVVKASNCSNRTSYIGSNQGNTVSFINCRSNPGYGDLFSWCAVILNRKKLCPDGWRLPVADDFVVLDIALGGDGETRPRYGVDIDASILDRYASEWGAVYSGNSNGSGLLGGQLDEVYYWQQTEKAAHLAGYSGLGRAGELTSGYTSEGKVSIHGAATTAMGMPIRCIRQALKK
ncbi:MAG: Ig-like domain-containing protein [Bacteroidales bacterium]|jgi:uncharacterized protein (TIGR02145 family)|nr:Ig-like domain-containing protein [Bacteroidales bacterium]